MLDGHAVLVDLPCSGARTLLLLLLAFAVAAAVVRPGLRAALLGAALTLVAALVSNTLRIAVLAIGIARPNYFGGSELWLSPGMTSSGWPRRPQAPRPSSHGCIG